MLVGGGHCPILICANFNHEFGENYFALMPGFAEDCVDAGVRKSVIEKNVWTELVGELSGFTFFFS